MIFASDLDQTLLYGTRFLADHTQPFQVVEVLDGAPISHMSDLAIHLLHEVHLQCLFVPVTTRTIEQYKRIAIFQNELVPRYAITSNGGHVLRDGQIDEQWSRQVRSKMINECAAIHDMLAGFARISHEQWVIRERMAEDLFFYSIIDRKKMPVDELRDFEQWVTEQNWSMSIQGRKLYLVPQAVNKRDASLYVCALEQDDRMIAAGDSLLDMPLLEAARLAVVPPHGEIYQLRGHNDAVASFHFTQASGMSASEEILQTVLASLRQELRAR
ncbi:HAD family hydrolase [Brevibacillus parabrevis]|uniref:HAD family hydrolase n=1 Tax=Brevibacillus parabrevis TaxID=54914 RepID=UPI0028D6364B|nr:HAD family hydrolase [Brevibacillus parabrevis]